jgi:predicted permease
LGIGVLAVLLLTSVNAAGLLLVRAERQRGERALRCCIGATRWQLAREMVFESSLLVATGIGLGILLAVPFVRMVLAFADASGTLGVQELSLPSPGRAVAASLIIVMMAGLICLAPLLRVAASSTGTQLRSGMAGSLGGRRWFTGRALVVSQISLSVVVVCGAYTFVSAYAALLGRDVGTSNLQALVVRLDYSPESGDQAGEYMRNMRALAFLADNPSVAASAVGSMVPISSASMTVSPLVAGHDPSNTRGFYNSVSDEFFGALGIPLRSGRAFGSGDHAQAAPVVIVSNAAARRLWPDISPIGKTVRFQDDAEPATVVGVVGDVAYQALDETPHIVWYVPLAQQKLGGFFHLVALPHAGQETPTAAALRAAARQLAPDRAPELVARVDERVDRTIAGPRFVATMTGVFGGLSLLLAAVGSYGAFAFLVAARRFELGLRSAVGASPQRLATMVFRDAGQLALLGAAVGVTLGAGAMKLLSVGFTDLPALSPALLSVGIASVVAAAMLAVVRPAMEASLIDPVQALRSE